jgi:hypothetical protein
MTTKSRRNMRRILLAFLTMLPLAGNARADQPVVSGRVKSVDLAAKKLDIYDTTSRKVVHVIVGDYSKLQLEDGRTIPLSRIKPGARVTVNDSLVASSIRVGDEVMGHVRLVEGNRVLLTQEGTGKNVQVAIGENTRIEAADGKPSMASIDELTPGSRVIVVRNGASTAERIIIEKQATGMLQEFWGNFRHNLFKPLLLFFYMGFLVPILRVKFEFPYVMYQALTIYLLIAIGWHGGEELSALKASELGSAVGFMGVGFVLNSLIGVLAYFFLSMMTRMRRIDRATVAGYYGSDSAGTFVTCLGVLASAGIAYQAYMPVMLAVMEIPGCLVALFLVSRLRHRGMDARGNMPDEPGYDPQAKPVPIVHHAHGEPPTAAEAAVESEEEMALERMEHEVDTVANGSKKSIFSPQLLHEVFLNPGLYLLFGGIAVGYISGLQGPEVTRADDSFFVTLFQGVLCLFLLEMGMTASRKLRDLRTAGAGFVAFGLIAPNIFATLGIVVAHAYSLLTGTQLALGTYVLFSVLCAAASYIAVPAVQRLAIPEASPTLPLAASLGLTFSYNVTIGIPVYIEIAKFVMRQHFVMPFHLFGY